MHYMSASVCKCKIQPCCGWRLGSNACAQPPTGSPTAIVQQRQPGSPCTEPSAQRHPCLSPHPLPTLPLPFAGRVGQGRAAHSPPGLLLAAPPLRRSAPL